LALMAGLLIGACSFDSGTPPATTVGRPVDDGPAITTTTVTTTPTTTTTRPPRHCRPQPTDAPTDLPTDPGAVSLAVSRATFPCADTVVVALSGTRAAGPAAAYAAAEGIPLLLVSAGPTADLQAEISRLDPHTVVVTAGVRAEWFPSRSVEPIPAGPGAIADTVPAPDPARIWLISGEAAAGWPAVWAAASASGEAAALVPPGGLLDSGDETAALLGESEGAVLAAIGLDDQAAWHVALLRSGAELPGGGWEVFPDRRLVAFYGNPLTPLLGVLGEQGAEATVDRILPFAEQYAADGIPTVPAFEIIATVASAVAGADGDYSEETDLEVIRPWVEAAATRDTYVILDLQPGRTDFLTQARIYEELLLEPHVGLALDPEWRLKPNQVHLRQIGTVDAAEINEVVDWLAALVRDNGLPQKLLLLHQFNLNMITNRDQVALPPELAVAIQMDGDGSPGAKQATWEVLTEFDEHRFWWGWKNFFDEDEPMPEPDFVLGQQPTIYLVSFQ
jgi:hypothetical protein